MWRVEDGEVDWYVHRGGNYERLPLGEDGIYRSEIFPGLWLDSAAMVREDLSHVLAVLQEGLNSGKHRRFVETCEVVSLERTAQAG